MGYFNIFNSIKQYFNNIDLQKKLLYYSIFITAIVITVLFLLSQNLVMDLIIQEQGQLEKNYTQIKGETISSFFEETEGNLRQLYNNTTIRNRLKTGYRPGNYNFIYESLNEITEEIEKSPFRQNYVDRIILLGINDFSYYYNWGEGGHFIDQGVSYEAVNDSSLLTEREEGLPFYFSEPHFEDVNSNISELLQNKIIYYRKIRGTDNRDEAIILISFKKELISELLKTEKKYVHVYDYSNNLIWSDNRQITPGTSVEEGSIRTETEAGEMLQVTRKVKPYGLKIITSTPLTSILKEVISIRNNFIIYGVLCLLGGIICSWYFSNKLTAPINKLAHKISGGLNKVILDRNKSGNFFSKMKIKHKILLYFFITIIIPYLLFGSLIFYNYYSIYEEKVRELITSNVTLAQQNLNYNLKKIEEITEYISYSTGVQNLLNEKNDQGDNYDPGNIFLTYPNLGKSNLLAMSLYNPDGDNIYSSIYFDSFPVTRINNNFFEVMEDSRGKLELLRVDNDLYVQPAVVFSREIRSIQSPNFQQLIGYSVFYLQRDIFKNLYYSLNREKDSHFLIMDQSGTIVSSDIDNPLETDNLMGLLDNSEDNYLRYKGQKYLFNLETTSPLQLRIIGLIPYEQITNKILPLIKTNLIYLLLCSLFLIGFSSLMSFKINRRLSRLGEGMERIKQEQNLTLQVKSEGGDEIAILTRRFNSMVSKLKELIRKNYEARIREKDLQFLEKEAQLNALQQQINPHFLYNTLEAIKWMAYKHGARDIAEMATALGKFFRGSITKSNEFITVKEELDHLKNYIYIQNLRYQDKFDTAFDIEEKVLKCRLPKLILQPIVENSITHGLEALEEGGQIRIKGFITGEKVWFQIEDTGVGMGREKVEQLRRQLRVDSYQGDDFDRSNIGLSNVHKRLKLYFGENSSFEIESKEGEGTMIMFSIPVILK